MPLTHDIGVRIPYPLPRATVIVAFFITDSPEQRDKGRRPPFEQTEQRDPDELRSSRRVVTFEDRRSEINSLSTTENNCNRSLFILHSTAPVQRPGIPIRTGCATEQCKDRLSRRKAAAPDIEEAHLAVLRPHSLSKIHRNQKQPGIRTAKIINSKLPACTGNISVRTAIFAGGLEIIHFSYAHRFGHCPKLLSCTLSRTAYRKYSATDVSGFRTDSARRLFDRRQP